MRAFEILNVSLLEVIVMLMLAAELYTHIVVESATFESNGASYLNTMSLTPATWTFCNFVNDTLEVLEEVLSSLPSESAIDTPVAVKSDTSSATRN